MAPDQWVAIPDMIVGNGVLTTKMKVPGGWIYRTVHVRFDSPAAIAMVFVPDPS